MPTGTPTPAAPTPTPAAPTPTPAAPTPTPAAPAPTPAAPARPAPAAPAAPARPAPAAPAAPASTSRISNLQVTPNFVNKVKGGALLVLTLAAHVAIGYGIYHLMISATSIWMLALCGYALYRTFVHMVKDYDDDKALMLKQN